MNTIEITTKYPELVEAAQKQNIPLAKIFAKCEDTDGDGSYDSFSYPMVKLDINGAIPQDDNGVLFDPMRLKAANMLAKTRGEDIAVQNKVAEAMKTVTHPVEQPVADDQGTAVPTPDVPHDASTVIGM